MNELELCLELLKLAISGDDLANLDSKQKTDLILETFQNIYKFVSERSNLGTAQIPLSENTTTKMLRAYRLSAKGELDNRSETIISTFKNLQMLNSNSKLAMEKAKESVSSAVPTEHNNENTLLNSAVFLFSSGNEDKFVVYVYDPEGKDNMPPAASFQLGDADEFFLFATRESPIDDKNCGKGC